jgi:hypothetical protein
MNEMTKQITVRRSDLLSRPRTNVGEGFEAWEWFYTHAVLAAERHRETGQLLSPLPDATNPKGDSLVQCLVSGEETFRFFAHRVGRNAMLKAIDTVLRIHRHHLSAKMRSLQPLFNKLEIRLDRDLYQVGKLLLIDADTVHDEALARADLHLCAYALIGFSVKTMPKPSTQPCKYCYFRLKATHSQYCKLHRMSHERRGEDNMYAKLERQDKIKDIYFQNLEDIHLRYGHFRIGLPAAEYQWAPFIDSYIVTKRSLSWLDRILAECPEINSLIGHEIMAHIAAQRWADAFKVLRDKVDPNDLRTDLEVWCDKLLSAQAWIAAEKLITGTYKNQPVVSGAGKMIRSGQHVGGKRGPKSTTSKKMEAAKKLAAKGFSIQMIANKMGETPKTVRQWKTRHPGFAESLSFYLAKVKGKVGQ